MPSRKTRYEFDAKGSTSSEFILDLASLIAEVAEMHLKERKPTEAFIRDLAVQSAFHAADHLVDKIWRNPQLLQSTKEELERLNHTLKLRPGQPYSTWSKPFNRASGKDIQKEIRFGFGLAQKLERKFH